MDLTLLVLAAGLGSRYGSLKQIDSIGPSGERIIDYSIYDAQRAGFNKVVYVIRESIKEEFEKLIIKKIHLNLKIETVCQEIGSIPLNGYKVNGRAKPWGTAHALLTASSVIDEPFIVINADDFYGSESFRIAANYLKSVQNYNNPEYALIGYKLYNTLSDYGSVSRGICQIDKNNNLISVTERTEIKKELKEIKYKDDDNTWSNLTGDEIVSMNMFILFPSIFSYCKDYFYEFLKHNSMNSKAEFFLPAVIDRLVKENKIKVKVLETSGNWFGLTYPEDKFTTTKKVQKLVNEGKYPQKLWKQKIPNPGLIARNFSLYGDYLQAKPLGNGHINDTFLITFNQAGLIVPYIIRRVNSFVFKDPEIVVKNSVNAVNHIKRKLIEHEEKEISRKVMTFIKTRDNKSYYLDENGDYWCANLYFSGSYTVDIVKTEKQAFEAAKSFGRFQKYLIDADINEYGETIKDFHNLSYRLESFEKALMLDPLGRKEQILKEVDMAEEYRYLSEKMDSMIKNKLIPRRVIHNDTKISNVLLDKSTNKGLAVIDLDTVMPGTILTDFGDMVRTFTNPASEDEKDLSKVDIRLNIFSALAKGYLNEVKEALTQNEADNLVYGAKVIIYEQFIRFLTDYILGDKYYHTSYTCQNLDRAKNQLALLQSAESKSPQMEDIVGNLAKA